MYKQKARKTSAKSQTCNKSNKGNKCKISTGEILKMSRNNYMRKTSKIRGDKLGV